MNWIYLAFTCITWHLHPTIHAQTTDALSTRSIIEQWIQAEKSVNKARTDWKLDLQNLTTHKNLLESENKSLEAQLSGLDERQESTFEKRENLDQRIADLESVQTRLEDRIKTSENSIAALLPKLPPLLRKKIESRLPKSNVSSTELNQQVSKLVRRLQKLIGIWTEIHQFQNEITVAKQVISLLDASEVEAEVLYLGLAQAYFVTADDQRSGIGKPQSSGWVWTEVPALGSEVRSALNALNLPDPRNPVTLPTTLTEEE